MGQILQCYVNTVLTFCREKKLAEVIPQNLLLFLEAGIS